MASNSTNKRNGMLKSLGPGLLFAGAAIGGSHLVQSTRAGADYGFFLVWAVLLANFFKYPFFEFAHRYTVATGESTVAAYRRLGRGIFLAFLLLVAVAAVMNTVAVTLITAGILGLILKLDTQTLPLAGAVLMLIVFVLGVGRFTVLDTVMKLLVAILGATTIVCVTTVFLKASPPQTPPPAISWTWSKTQVAFLIALMGWMPAPIDISTWSSLWILERKAQTSHMPSQRETHYDFHLGYLSTVVLAIAFLSLGATIMHGSGEHFSSSGVQFAGQLVGMYVSIFGSWTFLFIALLAFTTMFSTTLATFDGYTRTLEASLSSKNTNLVNKPKIAYWLILLSLVSSTLFILFWFLGSMSSLVDIATKLAFLSAPFFAYLNYRIVSFKTVAEKAPLPFWLRVLSIAGLIFLTAFSLLYLKVLLSS